MPVSSPCTHSLNCPGVAALASLKSDFQNAQNILDPPSRDLTLVLSMTFPDLSQPQEIRPQMAVLDDDALAVRNVDRCGWDEGELLWLLQAWEE